MEKYKYKETANNNRKRETSKGENSAGQVDNQSSGNLRNLNLSPLHTRLFPLPVFGMGARFAIVRPVEIEMTSLLGLFLVRLLVFKDKTWSIFRLGPGMLLSGSKQTKMIKTSLVCSGLYFKIWYIKMLIRTIIINTTL